MVNMQALVQETHALEGCMESDYFDKYLKTMIILEI